MCIRDRAGDTVVVVDDVITTGGSTLKAIDAIEAEGGRVAAALVSVSYTHLDVYKRQHQGNAFQTVVFLGDGFLFGKGEAVFQRAAYVVVRIPRVGVPYAVDGADRARPYAVSYTHLSLSQRAGIKKQNPNTQIPVSFFAGCRCV